MLAYGGSGASGPIRYSSVVDQPLVRGTTCQIRRQERRHDDSIAISIQTMPYMADRIRSSSRLKKSSLDGRSGLFHPGKIAAPRGP